MNAGMRPPTGSRQVAACGLFLSALFSVGLRADDAGGSAAPLLGSTEFVALATEIRADLSSDNPVVVAQCGDRIRAFAPADETGAQSLAVWRREKLQLWLIAISGVNAKLDPAFDPEIRPSLSVIATRNDGSALGSGIGADAIGEEDARSDYEKRIGDNAKRLAVYAYQNGLRRLSDEWIRSLRAYVVTHYSTSDEDDAEIRELLETRVPGSGMRQKLRAVLIDERRETAAQVRR